MSDDDNPRSRPIFSDRTWSVIAAAALLVAIAYAFVPIGAGSEGSRWLILRWGHSVAWVFFAAAAAARARFASLPIEWAFPLAGTGGLVYVVYMITSTTGA